MIEEGADFKESQRPFDTVNSILEAKTTGEVEASNQMPTRVLTLDSKEHNSATRGEVEREQYSVRTECSQPEDREGYSGSVWRYAGEREASKWLEKGESLVDKRRDKGW